MPKKYNRHGNARERYNAEYHEDRIFRSYLNSGYDFEGDVAKQNGYKSWNLRHVPSFKRHWTLRGIHYFVIGE